MEDRKERILFSNAASMPRPVDEPLLVFWGRGGLEPRLQSDTVRGYDLDQMLNGERERR